MPSPQRQARVTGVLYLIVGVFAAFAFYVRSTIYVAGDATATVRNVASKTDLVRLGVIADLVQATAFLFLALMLYGLLRQASRSAARAMVALVTVAVAMMCLNLVHQTAALLLATDQSYVDGLG